MAAYPTSKIQEPAYSTEPRLILLGNQYEEAVQKSIQMYRLMEGKNAMV